MSNPPRVYLVTGDPDLLKLRMLVLDTAKFATYGGSPAQAVSELPTMTVDVVVLCRRIGIEERASVKAVIPRGSHLVELQGFTWPEELIKEVRDRVAKPVR